ncbi:MAG: peptide chain release factor aRF-1 [Candidatus Nezhaarchaeales archaeon]|nr:MAG: peptide chain release factor 1 [Candidatus Nezhaarchaeota archaeon WYZ-LMO8]TDA35106.1 MAG: peptide chain release factor 1 [Candidatus Nezhaarchaeota archaeon WYZ-LMO7]
MTISIDKVKLERLVKELKSKMGRGTELISLYIPAGRPLGEVTSALREELSTAANIKDRTTRHHVLDALTVTLQRLKLFTSTPKNGLVIFAGYIPRGPPGSEKMEVYVIEPPEPINTYLYRCDSRFHTEILEEMLEEKGSYGIIVIDRSSATFALLTGRRLKILDEITSGVPGKHSAGGQSARRFERVIEIMAHEFYKRAGEYAQKLFSEVKDLKGIILGGPGPTKNDFYDGDYLPYDLKRMVIGIVDVGYTGEEGVYEVIERAQSLLEGMRYVHEKQVIQKFLEYLAKKSDLIAYGYREVYYLLKQGVVDTLIVSEDVPLSYVKVSCSTCGWTNEDLVREDEVEEFKGAHSKCPVCGQVTNIEQGDVIEYLVELSKTFNTKIEIISSGTEEGKGFLESFKGMAAILRYAPR